MRLKQLEAIIERRLVPERIYDFSKLKFKAKTLCKFAFFDERQHMFSFEKKVGNLFQFRNVAGGYTTTLSALQLNGRFKEVI